MHTGPATLHRAPASLFGSSSRRQKRRKHQAGTRGRGHGEKTPARTRGVRSVPRPEHRAWGQQKHSTPASGLRRGNPRGLGRHSWSPWGRTEGSSFPKPLRPGLSPGTRQGPPQGRAVRSSEGLYITWGQEAYAVSPFPFSRHLGDSWTSQTFQEPRRSFAPCLAPCRLEGQQPSVGDTQLLGATVPSGGPPCPCLTAHPVYGAYRQGCSLSLGTGCAACPDAPGASHGELAPWRVG